MNPSPRQTVARLSLVGLSMFMGLPQEVWSAPEGAQTVRGDVHIDQNGSKTVIHASDRAIINYTRFDILKHETVQFLQPNSAAWVLNRVLSSSSTEIYGTLLANGRVMLVNPAGVYFGASATVDVNQLIVSGLDLSDESFLSGEWDFSQGEGAVLNEGQLSAQKIVLIGRQVFNSGSLVAQNGLVVLAAGERVVVRDLDKKLYVEVDGKTMEAVRDGVSTGQGRANPRTGTAIENTGEIAAGSGEILLFAGDLYSQAVTNAGRVAASVTSGRAGKIQVAGGGKVTNTGAIEANSSDGQGGSVLVKGTEIAQEGAIEARGGGEVIVTSGGNGTTIVTGTVDASNAVGIGGTVHLLGNRVGLVGNAVIDVSGKAGGGEALIGGDYQGEVMNAARTFVGSQVTISADALVHRFINSSQVFLGAFAL